MMRSVEGIAKRLGRSLGIDIRHYRPFARRRFRQIVDYEIATVVDVGANVGEYALELRRSGYRGAIISLEPRAAAYAELARRAARDDSWECYPVAAGSADHEAIINVASNAASSSLLPMRDEHRQGAPDVTYVAQERIVMRRLDSLDLDPGCRTLLKLDVQGYELEVLAGATQTLARARLIECEVGLASLYEGQPPFHSVIEHLAELGFEIVDIDPFFYASDGRVLALDAIFVRTA